MFLKEYYIQACVYLIKTPAKAESYYEMLLLQFKITFFLLLYIFKCNLF